MKSTAESLPLEGMIARGLAAAGVEQGAKMLVGFSGGPDSTALLCGIGALAGECRYTIWACLVDHGIRPRAETDGDLSFARALCESLGLQCLVRSIPGGSCAARAREEKRSLEDVARDLRLGLLQEAAREVGAEVIALGHTRDDAVETILMRALQGSGPAGLSGIRARRGLFIHPLLGAGRSDVLSYLAARGTSYRTDSTNSDPAILRNRMRTALIPALESTFPGFRSGLLSMGRKLAFFNNYIEEEVTRRLPWRPVGAGFVIHRQDFVEAPAALRAFSLLHLYDTLRLPPRALPRRLPFRFLEPVLRGELPAGAVLLRGHGVRLRSEGDALAWERDIVTAGEKSYFIAVDKAGSHRFQGAMIMIEKTSGSCTGTGADEAPVCAQGVERPLALRSRRKGDEISLNGAESSIKVLYNAWKVPDSDRWKIPLLVDRRGIVAVLGGARGFPTRVRTGGGGECIFVRVRRPAARGNSGMTEGEREQQL